MSEFIVSLIGIGILTVYEVLGNIFRRKFEKILKINGIILYFISNSLSVFIIILMRSICMKYHIYGRKYSIIYMLIYAFCLLLNMSSIYKLEDYFKKAKKQRTTL